jgi:hypothetical protein
MAHPLARRIGRSQRHITLRSGLVERKANATIAFPASGASSAVPVVPGRQRWPFLSVIAGLLACPPFHRVRATARKATSRIVMMAGGHGPLVGDDGERSSNLARAGRTSSSTRKRQGPRVAQGDGNVRPPRSRAVSASSALPTRGTGRDRLTDVTRIRYARRWPVYR